MECGVKVLKGGSYDVGGSMPPLPPFLGIVEQSNVALNLKNSVHKGLGVIL